MPQAGNPSAEVTYSDDGKYYYLITYNHYDPMFPGQYGFGYAGVAWSAPIDHRNIEEVIAKIKSESHLTGNVCPTSFTLLSVPMPRWLAHGRPPALRSGTPKIAATWARSPKSRKYSYQRRASWNYNRI